jgi:hypothetical protein
MIKVLPVHQTKERHRKPEKKSENGAMVRRNGHFFSTRKGSSPGKAKAPYSQADRHMDKGGMDGISKTNVIQELVKGAD